MTLVVGLGNPGNEYLNTRHNVGFMLIDKLLQDDDYINISNNKFQGELYKKGSLLLLKPQTFMNLSGNSLKAVRDFYKPEKIIVIHDDIDLKFGAVRFKNGGSSGGHNGLKSIDSLIGSDYDRVRIGVGKRQNVISHVLSDFSQDERERLEEILSHCKKSVLELIDKDIKFISDNYTLKVKES